MQPTRIWRTIRGPKANYKVAFYSTKERRDAAARRDADKDGESVMCESWTKEVADRCDPINQGWATDNVVGPQ